MDKQVAQRNSRGHRDPHTKLTAPTLHPHHEVRVRIGSGSASARFGFGFGSVRVRLGSASIRFGSVRLRFGSAGAMQILLVFVALTFFHKFRK